MRELESLIKRITKIIEGYIFSERFGQSRFDINDEKKFTQFINNGYLDDGVKKEETAESQGTLKALTSSVYKSSAFILSSFESIVRLATSNPKTLHRFPTIQWLYAIRSNLMSLNVEFESIRSSRQLSEFKTKLFEAIDDLFLTVDLLLKTPSDDAKPIIKTLDKDYALVGLHYNQSDLRTLLEAKLFKNQNSADYRSHIKDELDKVISIKDDVICANSKVEKSKRDMQGKVNELQARVRQLTSDLEFNRHLVEVRTLQMNESDARMDELQKKLRAKDQARAELQVLVDKLGKEKAKIAKALAEQKKQDKNQADRIKESIDRQADLERRLRELEESQAKAEREAQDASANVQSLTVDLDRERAVQSGLKDQLTVIQEQTKAVEDQLNEPELEPVENGRQSPPGQNAVPVPADYSILSRHLQEIDKADEFERLGKTLRSLHLNDDEDQSYEEVVESDLTVANTEVGWSQLNGDTFNLHLREHLAANFRRVEVYPHLVEPDQALQCTKAQYHVYQSDPRQLAEALSANPNLLNAICRGDDKDLRTKSLIEIALFYTHSRTFKREARLEVLRLLLDRLPDISNTNLYESIKDNLNNPRISCNADLKSEYCLYATAHNTCSIAALDDFFVKNAEIKKAKALLKQSPDAVLFENKSVSQLLAELQKEFYACKLLCDGYINGHFDAFDANLTDAPKDLFAALNFILLSGVEQRQSDIAYKNKHGRFHYQAELMNALEPKYALCSRFTMGGSKHKFADKVLVDLPDSPVNPSAKNSNVDAPRGVKLFNVQDAKSEPLLAAYGQLVKNMFLMISRYGVVLSSKDGFNKYQRFMINRRLAANMQAKKMLSVDDANNNGPMNNSYVMK